LQLFLLYNVIISNFSSDISVFSSPSFVNFDFSYGRHNEFLHFWNGLFFLITVMCHVIWFENNKNCVIMRGFLKITAQQFSVKSLDTSSRDIIDIFKPMSMWHCTWYFVLSADSLSHDHYLANGSNITWVVSFDRWMNFCNTVHHHNKKNWLYWIMPGCEGGKWWWTR